MPAAPSPGVPCRLPQSSPGPASPPEPPQPPCPLPAAAAWRGPRRRPAAVQRYRHRATPVTGELPRWAAGGCLRATTPQSRASRHSPCNRLLPQSLPTAQHPRHTSHPATRRSHLLPAHPAGGCIDRRHRQVGSHLDHHLSRLPRNQGARWRQLGLGGRGRHAGAQHAVRLHGICQPGGGGHRGWPEVGGGGWKEGGLGVCATPRRCCCCPGMGW